MDDRLKNLWADLEAYIQENWIASEEEIPVSGVVCGRITGLSLCGQGVHGRV